MSDDDALLFGAHLLFIGAVFVGLLIGLVNLG